MPEWGGSYGGGGGIIDRKAGTASFIPQNRTFILKVSQQETDAKRLQRGTDAPQPRPKVWFSASLGVFSLRVFVHASRKTDACAALRLRRRLSADVRSGRNKLPACRSRISSACFHFISQIQILERAPCALLVAEVQNPNGSARRRGPANANSTGSSAGTSRSFFSLVFIYLFFLCVVFAALQCIT